MLVRLLITGGCTLAIVAGAHAQSSPSAAPIPPSASDSSTVSSPAVASPMPPAQTGTAASSGDVAPAAKTISIPAGTKVLLSIRSAVNTKTAQVGDGVYLQSTFPVVANGRTVIPPGVYVQGVVDAVERHIRIKGPAKLTMHFTSMIFPNGSVVEIPGMVNSLPGSDGPRVKGSEGTVEQHSSAGDIAKAAGQGAAAGAGIGGIAGGVNGHPLEGLGVGGAAGGIAGAAISLFTHGNDINIPSGTPIEMVLQAPLVLQTANLEGRDMTGEYLPAPSQRQRMQKPTPMTCPPGGLGCN